MDSFEYEQEIFNRSKSLVKDGCTSPAEYAALSKEYGKLLKLFRKVMRLSNKNAVHLYESNIGLTEKVYHDALTGIYDRRFMDECLRQTIKSLSRAGGTLSVIMADIDFFKKYNDTYGHSAGDDCLKVVAQALSDCITREDDFIARYGGEEFVIALPYTDEDGACLIADKLLQNVIDRKIPHKKNAAADCVTISLGVTTAKVGRASTAGDYIKYADKAMYLSKQNGRNRYTYMDFTGAD